MNKCVSVVALAFSIIMLGIAPLADAEPDRSFFLGEWDREGKYPVLLKVVAVDPPVVEYFFHGAREKISSTKWEFGERMLDRTLETLGASDSRDPRLWIADRGEFVVLDPTSDGGPGAWPIPPK